MEKGQMVKKIEKTERQKLGFIGLAALVFGMMVGAGIFNIPQNMASGAGLGAVIISWLITAGGMMLLVMTFKVLSDKRPDLNTGIYQYARVGYGNFAGFCVGWGYWLCTCFANIAYAVMLNDTLGAFFPVFNEYGWPTILFGSVLVWSMCFVVCGGMRTAKTLTTVLSVLKVAAIILIIVLMGINMKLGFLSADFWGRAADLGGLGKQIQSTMMVALWCFIGIEGAVMMSGRAKHSETVGLAGVTGFLVAWILYVLVSVFSFGLMSHAELAGLPDPSVAYVLKSVCGDWAYYLVVISVAVSLLGGWVAWTLVCGEVPYEAAASGIFPKIFNKENKKGMPVFGLVISSVVMQLFLILVVTAEDVYMSALSITGMMILPAYLVSGLFLLKISSGDGKIGDSAKRSRTIYKWIGAGSTLFCLWMIYAGGLELLMMTSIFYVFGLGFYVEARREHNPGAPAFTRKEKWVVAAICVLAVVSVVGLLTGMMTI